MFEMLQFWSNVSRAVLSGRKGGEQAALGQGGFGLVWKWGSINFVGRAPLPAGCLSHTDPEPHVTDALVCSGGRMTVPCGHFHLRLWTAGPGKLPKAGTLEHFGVTFVLVLLNSKVEEKKHRSPRGEKQTKGKLLKFEIYLEIKKDFHQSQKPSLLMLPVQKSHKAKGLLHLF